MRWLRSSWAPLASVGVHGLLAAVALRAPIEPPPPVEIEALTFELNEPEPPPEPEPPAPEEALPEAIPEEEEEEPEETRSRPAAIARIPRPSVATVELAEPTSLGSGPTVAPPLPTEPSPEPAPRVLSRAEQLRLINPALAVPNIYVPTGPGPSRRGPPAGRVLESNRPTEQELEAQHGGYLRERAMVREWLSHSNYDLHRQPDGSYLYAGHAFDARILPDGSVDFRARDNVRIDGPDLTNIPFDLDNMIHDVYAYERQRFMDHTEALRERLEAEHRVQTDTQALRILPGRLAGIWRQTTRSAAARRRRIFELWDEIADDETGRRARAVVTRWVLENLPPGSEDAYSEAELARLNATRESPAPFSPY